MSISLTRAHISYIFVVYASLCFNVFVIWNLSVGVFFFFFAGVEFQAYPPPDRAACRFHGLRQPPVLEAAHFRIPGLIITIVFWAFNGRHATMGCDTPCQE